MRPTSSSFASFAKKALACGLSAVTAAAFAPALAFGASGYGSYVEIAEVTYAGNNKTYTQVFASDETSTDDDAVQRALDAAGIAASKGFANVTVTLAKDVKVSSVGGGNDGNTYSYPTGGTTFGLQVPEGITFDLDGHTLSNTTGWQTSDGFTYSTPVLTVGNYTVGGYSTPTTGSLAKVTGGTILSTNSRCAISVKKDAELFIYGTKVSSSNAKVLVQGDEGAFIGLLDGASVETTYNATGDSVKSKSDVTAVCAVRCSGKVVVGAAVRLDGSTYTGGNVKVSARLMGGKSYTNTGTGHISSATAEAIHAHGVVVNENAVIEASASAAEGCTATSTAVASFGEPVTLRDGTYSGETAVWTYEGSVILDGAYDGYITGYSTYDAGTDATTCSDEAITISGGTFTHNPAYDPHVNVNGAVFPGVNTIADGYAVEETGSGYRVYDVEAADRAAVAAVKSVIKTFKASKLKKSSASFNLPKGVDYKKMSGSKKITVNKAGKVTVKKGTKKGTYKVKVKVSRGDVFKTITVTAKVK